MRSRFVAVLAATGVACILGVVGTVHLQADQESDALLAELEAAFATMPFDHAHQMVSGSDGLAAFQSLTSVRADSIVYADPDPSFSVRYPIEYYGFDRCLIVEFRPASIEFEQATGSRCTRYRGS